MGSTGRTMNKYRERYKENGKQNFQRLLLKMIEKL